MSWTDTYMPTSLRGIANRAIREPKHRFGDLYRLLNEQNLRWCFYQLRKKSAPGVDEVTFEQYERNLDDNLADLVERLKGNRYRAKLVRRKHIPKGNGKTRPLGIPALEDKLLQLAAAKILSAIYEGDFLECSWGYRGGRGAREASRVLADTLCSGRYGWIVEADIKGFFDHLDHDWMVEMLGKRVNDRALIRLIRKWMKAGVLEEDGKVIHPAAGTPQGGIISPVLSKTSGVLGVLRSEGQLQKSVKTVQRVSATAVQMVEQTESEAQLQLGRVQENAQTFRYPPAANYGAGPAERTVQLGNV